MAWLEAKLTIVHNLDVHGSLLDLCTQLSLLHSSFTDKACITAVEGLEDKGQELNTRHTTQRCHRISSKPAKDLQWPSEVCTLIALHRNFNVCCTHKLEHCEVEILRRLRDVLGTAQRTSQSWDTSEDPLISQQCHCPAPPQVSPHWLGARVMCPFTVSCGGCFYCKAGATCRCSHPQAHVFGWVEAGSAAEADASAGADPSAQVTGRVL